MSGAASNPDRVYMGVRRAGVGVVWVAWPGGGRWLRARHRRGCWYHGPGLEWGYGGSGPAQLALEILVDALGDVARAARLHQRFKWAVISQLPGGSWCLHREAVLAQVEELEAGPGEVSPIDGTDRVSLAEGWDGSAPEVAKCMHCRGLGYVVLAIRPDGAEECERCERCGGTGRA